MIDLKRAQREPAYFRSVLKIDTDAGPVRLGKVCEPWQRDAFEAMDPGWQNVVHRTGDGPGRFWCERPRGHSKTADIATMATWALFASRRKLSGVAAAADGDQANLLRNAISMLITQNPWLGDVLKLRTGKVINKHTDSELNIIASDAPTSYGLLVDFIVADELTCWKNRKLWDSLLSSAAKRKHCLLAVLTNAGHQATWQYKTRKQVGEDPAWSVSILDGPMASWIDAKRLAEQERLLPPSVYRRLWHNEWSSGDGDALPERWISDAITQPGPCGPEPGWIYVAGLDLGLRHDATALVILGRHAGETTRRAVEKRQYPSAIEAQLELGYLTTSEPDFEETHVPATGRLKLCGLSIWEPRGGEICLNDVENAIVTAHERFGLQAVGADAWQAAGLAQRLQGKGIAVEALAPTSILLQGIAKAVLDVFRGRRLDLYPHTELLADVRAARLVEKSYGVRIESPKNAEGGTGHGDTLSALGLAIYLGERIRGQAEFRHRQLVLS
ncbi:MAG: hypothetical protein HQ582_31515 [Planctomycetes bacterium]|nr:hypothetical protein [Planctomycetota bacterium]